MKEIQNDYFVLQQNWFKISIFMIANIKILLKAMGNTIRSC